MTKGFFFIDEFGTSSLTTEKQGTTSHFVYCAVGINESNIDQAREIRDLISKEYFQGSPIKSSNIKNDEKGFSKRLKILDEILKLDFSIFGFVIDKTKIDGPGIKQKKVFYKFFQRLFVQQFSDNFDQFEIYADKIGDENFQRTLSEHIYKNSVQRDLFKPDRLYKLADDKVEEPLIQLADFLSGCLGKTFCTSHYDERSNELFDKLNNRLFLDFFPYSKENYLGKEQEGNNEENLKVAEIAIDVALKFVENGERDSRKEDLEVLRFLLLMFRSKPNKVISTADLLAIVHRFNPNFTERQLRQRIGYLRDKGVLIVSMEGEHGYKLPNKRSDLIRYYNRLLKSIVPMIKRINSSSGVIKLKTLNEIDVIESVEEYDMLREFIKIVDLNKS